MLKRATQVSTLAGLIVLLTAAIKTSAGSPDRLTAHEWGTFTSIAGKDGKAIEWLPLGGPTDLPCFVEHFNNKPTSKILPTEDVVPLDYETARSKLFGRVRMETPVLYFYGPTKTVVDVTVQFQRGLITEFYPHGDTFEPVVTSTSLRHPGYFSQISWRASLGAPPPHGFLTEPGKSHYYAARETEATPLTVGPQSEKFLFYRGVANFDVPLSAVATGRGVALQNLGAEEIPNVVLFERHNGAISYRIGGALRGSMTLSAPATPGTIETLRAELQAMLIDAGLFPKEAAAMLETWRDSWFEEGTRVFYIVPRAEVDRVLPLKLTPVPSSIARVFVGRMEVITPLTRQTVESAIAHGDARVLEQYARFLGPITDRILETTSDAAAKARTRSAAGAAYTAYIRRSTNACE